jgi:TonB family protein
MNKVEIGSTSCPDGMNARIAWNQARPSFCQKYSLDVPGDRNHPPSTAAPVGPKKLCRKAIRCPKNSAPWLQRSCDIFAVLTSNTNMVPATIFEQSTVGNSWRPRRALPLSVGLHVIFFVLLLRGRSPVFVAPSSTLGGAHGTSVTHLYWAAGSSGLVESKSTNSRSKESARSRLLYQKSGRAQQQASNLEPSTEEGKRAQQAAAPAPAPSAGSPYGSLSEGASAGEEIRPALPAVTSEPRVDSDDLRGIAEGNVVVEIVIDEGGTIVRKSVVQSMGPAIDAKVLAALENWRFRPATRDGVPIPSKQDVVYHFKPRAG